MPVQAGVPPTAIIGINLMTPIYMNVLMDVSSVMECIQAFGTQKNPTSQKINGLNVDLVSRLCKYQVFFISININDNLSQTYFRY